MNVLIIKTSSLGDIIHALAVIDYLHRVSPGIEIDWVAEEQFLPVLEHNPGLRRIFPVRTKKWRKAPFSAETRSDLKALRRGLRECSYDMVFDIQGNLKSGLIAWLTGARERVGFTRDVLQEKANALFTTRRIPFRENDRNVTDRYLRVVSAPFDRDYQGMEPTGAIFSAPEDEAAAERYRSELPDGLVAVFQVGTTWSTKLWYPEGWVELARRIVARYPGATILINWGSPDEKALGERIAGEVGPAVRLLPWLRIRELIPLLKRVDLVIGGDTGPVYLAAAVGTPTVSYYRATSAATYAPRGERHRTVQAAMECAACYRTSCERDGECRHSISVDALFAAVTDLMGPYPNGRKDVPC
ncbi:lipopolysaccharide heptosyltransferase I [Geobacter sp. FeAm09]|uniref:lipopolysaccharide heptosyltransferase I n=1 Tax=Geobacter sp. FeAm09 TaxID=2597769 RepID=UPI0011EEAD7E|nr:lipopolysaccharide heptosyltransferase I [Geobacter sp. FeAm09]QEM67237.1 lipopolysaccharide heptosyltransferase I [Geobacter sp. FeAm09]